MTIDEAYDLSRALDNYLEWLTDNSCGDPACCGGPYYNMSTLSDDKALLIKNGIIIDEG